MQIVGCVSNDHRNDLTSPALVDPYSLLFWTLSYQLRVSFVISLDEAWPPFDGDGIICTMQHLTSFGLDTWLHSYGLMMLTRRYHGFWVMSSTLVPLLCPLVLISTLRSTVIFFFLFSPNLGFFERRHTSMTPNKIVNLITTKLHNSSLSTSQTMFADRLMLILFF
jgi:hypothetical protein